MNGHVRKRGDKWEVILELGEQPAQRCPACVTVDARGRQRGRLHWSDAGTLDACPTCGGELDTVVSRRQIVLRDRPATKKAAEKAMRDALHEREHGHHVDPVDMTVAQYLVDHWLPTLDALELRPNTKLAYRLHVEKRIMPHIGAIPLQKLTYNDVVMMHARLATEPGPRGAALSPATRRGVLATLHKALGEAVKGGLLRANPAAGVKYPKIERTQRMNTWTDAELDSFLRATAGDYLFPLWIVLAKSGMRRGEALGLQWSDVDLDTGSLYIERSRHQVGYDVVEGPLKNGEGRHVRIGAGTVAALKAWKARQNTLRLQWGPAWHGSDHVFTRENGEPWHPNRITELFGEAVGAAGVPKIRLHDLRHTHATLALRAGEPPKVVQERLGHKSIKITMDTYSHVLPDMQEGITTRLDAVVYGETAQP